MQYYILLYSRFFTKGINKIDKKINCAEPFKNLFTQGMVCHETYKDENKIGYTQKKFLKLTIKM